MLEKRTLAPRAKRLLLRRASGAHLQRAPRRVLGRWALCVWACGLWWAVAGVAKAEGPPKERLSIQLSGGIVGFPALPELNPGAAFGVSVGWRFLPLLAVEAGYLGSVLTEDGGPAGMQQAAFESGGYAALLASPLEWRVSPYALVGVGLSHRRIVGEEEVAALRPGTFVRLPLGIGAELRVRLFTIGVRGSYDFVFRSEAARSGAGPRIDDELFLTLRLGALF